MSGEMVPIPQIDVRVREATLADVPFIDSLQKQNDERVGFLALSWIENKIAAGQVLIALNLPSPAGRGQGEGTSEREGARFATPTRPHPDPLPEGEGERIGYVISQDKYLKREELGLIVQLCVVKGAQRKLIGATLLKAAFDRAAYGCRLFCLWCAQDIDANRFWEAMGFVPLAYRAGSEKKARVHIFWQRRIRSGDDVTPWWFPSTTGGGAMRADRIVLPIPPGKHWADEMPVILPAMDRPALAGPVRRKAADGTPAPRGRSSAAVGRANTLRFTPPAPVKVEKPKREKKPKVKADPKLVAAARELRDRWLEQVNAGAYMFGDAGKYDVARVLSAPVKPVVMLPAA